MPPNGPARTLATAQACQRSAPYINTCRSWTSMDSGSRTPDPEAQAWTNSPGDRTRNRAVCPTSLHLFDRRGLFCHGSAVYSGTMTRSTRDCSAQSNRSTPMIRQLGHSTPMHAHGFRNISSTLTLCSLLSNTHKRLLRTEGSLAASSTVHPSIPSVRHHGLCLVLNAPNINTCLIKTESNVSAVRGR